MDSMAAAADDLEQSLDVQDWEGLRELSHTMYEGLATITQPLVKLTEENETLWIFSVVFLLNSLFLNAPWFAHWLTIF